MTDVSRKVLKAWALLTSCTGLSSSRVGTTSCIGTLT